MKETINRFDTITGVREIPITLNEDFLTFAGRFTAIPGTVALMSGGKLDCARHHILGIRPWISLRGRGTTCRVQTAQNETIIHGNLLETLRHFLNHFNLATPLPISPISAGFLGYLAYDLKDAVEDLPRTAIDDLCLPHLYLTVPSILILHDKVRRQTRLFLPERQSDDGSRITGDLDWFSKMASGPAPEESSFRGDVDGFAANFSRSAYMSAIRRIQAYIASGDVYQVNMSQRFGMNFEGDPFALFRTLYRMNPAPFFAYINAGDHHIVSTSPERFILQEGRAVETRPIKGTRPRGKTPSEDDVLRRALLDSPKDDAELSMIVDLMRNDIGKVCSPGSIQVSEHKRIETYRNVCHLVSKITGTLETGNGSVDLIKAVFPGGSITGCPKIRAMEIIDEFEPSSRHIYTGAIGYISFHDTMDLSIAIRTATIQNDRILFSVGGGVVYDSDPSDEFEETLHKGETLLSVFRTGKTGKRASGPWAWINGRLYPLSQAIIPATHPGVQFGHGFFETIRVDTGRPRYLSAHIARFNGAWHHLFPGDAPDLSWDVIIRQVIDKNHLGNQVAAVKILALLGSRTEPPFDHTLMVTARSYTHRLAGRDPGGLRLVTYPHPRQTPLADYKTLNYLYYRMAGQWAKARGGDEALILNPDGTVSETDTANIILVKNRQAWLPRSAHALPGIMVRKVENILSRDGFTVSTATFIPQDLFEMDIVLLSNSLMEIVPVLSLDDAPLKVAWRLFEDICRAIR